MTNRSHEVGIETGRKWKETASASNVDRLRNAYPVETREEVLFRVIPNHQTLSQRVAEAAIGDVADPCELDEFWESLGVDPEDESDGITEDHFLHGFLVGACD